MSPRVACQSLWRCIETLRHNKAWLEAYREARVSRVERLLSPPERFG